MDHQCGVELAAWVESASNKPNQLTLEMNLGLRVSDAKALKGDLIPLGLIELDLQIVEIVADWVIAVAAGHQHGGISSTVFVDL